jgi:hypothetical protein
MVEKVLERGFGKVSRGIVIEVYLDFDSYIYGCVYITDSSSGSQDSVRL